MTFEKVKEIIVDTLGCDEEAVVLTANLKDDLGADSLDLFELVMAFEEEYGIEIPTEELEGIETVGDIIKTMQDNGVA